jgi:gamma-glutamylcyclotransferase (GGCT)/AIG2-like uncharacterized protein YtfP
MLYYAYGSNMDWSQMKERCPSAKFVAVAEFPNHRLAFTRKSRDRGCGVSDVVPDINGNVWGVVYEIAETEIGLLDRREGYRPGRDRMENSYIREVRHVLRDGDKNEPLLVSIYIGIPQDNPPKPNAEYQRLLVDGAIRWRLPQKYIEKLKQISTEG